MVTRRLITCGITPYGFAAFIDPANMTLCNIKDRIETLAADEKALCSGAILLVGMTLYPTFGIDCGAAVSACLTG